MLLAKLCLFCDIAKAIKAYTCVGLGAIDTSDPVVLLQKYIQHYYHVAGSMFKAH